MIVFSLAVGLLQDFIIPFGIQNIWIGSIVGGFWMGISLGILAKLNASLGGGSLLGKMLNLRYGFSLSKSIFFHRCFSISVEPFYHRRKRDLIFLDLNRF